MPGLLLQQKQNIHTQGKTIFYLLHLINQTTYPVIISHMKGEKATIRDVQLQINNRDARFVAGYYQQHTPTTQDDTSHVLCVQLLSMLTPVQCQTTMCEAHSVALYTI